MGSGSWGNGGWQKGKRTRHYQLLEDLQIDRRYEKMNRTVNEDKYGAPNCLLLSNCESRWYGKSGEKNF